MQSCMDSLSRVASEPQPGIILQGWACLPNYPGSLVSGPPINNRSLGQKGDAYGEQILGFYRMRGAVDMGSNSFEHQN